jgi:hypothetical protein
LLVVGGRGGIEKEREYLREGLIQIYLLRGGNCGTERGEKVSQASM